MQPSAVDSMDKYNENLTDVKEIFRKGDLRAIPKPLLKWYDNNRRILPWREDPAPYRVWVSEIMLQQTRSGKALFPALYGDVAGYCCACAGTGRGAVKAVGGPGIL